MSAKDLFNKFFVISIYTSVIISVLMSAPILSIPAIPLKYSLHGMVIFFISCQIIWFMNVSLLYIFNNKFGRAKTHFRYLISYIVGIGSIIIGTILFKDSLIPDNLDKGSPKSQLGPYMIAIFINSFILFIQELILLREKKSKIEIENAFLLAKNAEAANLLLKQQIQPHFLFNALSTLKALIKSNTQLAEEYTVTLSNFLRASISYNKKDIARISEELELCSSYINLQSIRFGDVIRFEYEIPDNIIQEGFVPAFSIQLLLENAIKHNAATETTPLKIHITYHDNWLRVENNINKKQILDQNTKSGLLNLSERYRMISGEDVRVLNDQKSFVVELEVLSDENSHNRG
ncbi:hypothetical protein SDC9_98143 [bioreactor metagenome]|uniref:Signal transduction histidine kinase internal region domain-containing protein n=1 Tax=bioreactor metagenome TaxID=1076179 RepID=A0A645ADW3_9ZZZZ